MFLHTLRVKTPRNEGNVIALCYCLYFGLAAVGKKIIAKLTITIQIMELLSTKKGNEKLILKNTGIVENITVTY